MLSNTTDREPIEAVAAEYAERCRCGERVSIEEYAQRFPDLADEIRNLFPAIKAMEQLNAKRAMDSGATRNRIPEQFGDYRVIGEIARGGMGIVYEAEQLTLGRRVAVKVLPRHALTRERDIRRFEREAQTAAKLHHSNIVPVFGVGQDDGHHYIVMQLIRGVGLDEILSETKRMVTGERGSITSARSSTVKRSAIGLLENELRRDTAVNCNAETVVSSSGDDDSEQTESSTNSPSIPSLLQIQSVVGAEYSKNVARIGLQAAEALHYAHTHDTLHRDVKPGNLLLDAEGCVWMADFGLAKAVENDSVTNSGDVVGTLAYVAPERFRGETTERSDIYSLGITLHEMLTLQRAFTGKDRVTIMSQVANERLPSPRMFNPCVPRDLETIVMKAASHDAADRYATAGDLASDLEAFLADRPIQARRLSKLEHTVRWCRRNRSMAVLAASVVFLLAAVFGVTVAGYFQSERQRQQSDAVSRLAVSVLDEFYTRFASGGFNVPATNDTEGTEGLVGNAPLPLSKDVAFMLDKMLPVYDEFSQRTNDSEFVAIKSITANGRVGEIHRRLGALGEARRSYEAAIERIDQLSPAQRTTEAVRLESAWIHNGLGIVLLQEDRHSNDAAKHHREAIKLLEGQDTSEQQKFELARSLYLLHMSSRRNEATTRDPNNGLDRAKEMLGQLEKSDPNRPEYQFLLARCLLANKSGCGSNGELNQDQANAIRILEGLVKTSPDNPDYQFELGDTYRSIEWSEFRRYRDDGRDANQLNRSVARLRRALEATANLEVRHPNIPQYSLSKKMLHHLLAAALQEQGKLDEASIEYIRAIEKQRLVISQASDSSTLR